jgi:hypothetical protein
MLDVIHETRDIQRYPGFFEEKEWNLRENVLDRGCERKEFSAGQESSQPN